MRSVWFLDQINYLSSFLLHYCVRVSMAIFILLLNQSKCLTFIWKKKSNAHILQKKISSKNKWKLSWPKTFLNIKNFGECWFYHSIKKVELFWPLKYYLLAFVEPFQSKILTNSLSDIWMHLAWVKQEFCCFKLPMRSICFFKAVIKSFLCFWLIFNWFS